MTKAWAASSQKPSSPATSDALGSSNAIGMTGVSMGNAEVVIMKKDKRTVANKTKKRGRPYNSAARKVILEAVRKNPGMNHYRLWKAVRGSGISKGLFCHVLCELEERGKICRKETTRISKTVTFHLINLNDLTQKSRSHVGKGDSSCGNQNSGRNHEKRRLSNGQETERPCQKNH